MRRPRLYWRQVLLSPVEPTAVSLRCRVRLQLDDFTAAPCEFRLARASSALVWKGLRRIGGTLLSPSTQHRACTPNPARLRHHHPAFLNQLHRLQLTRSCKLASLHVPPRFHSYIHQNSMSLKPAAAQCRCLVEPSAELWRDHTLEDTFTHFVGA